MAEQKNEPKKNWHQLQAELKSALDEWDQVSKKIPPRLSPDEEHLAEIRMLLAELQSKMKNFDIE